MSFQPKSQSVKKNKFDPEIFVYRQILKNNSFN